MNRGGLARVAIRRRGEGRTSSTPGGVSLRSFRTEDQGGAFSQGQTRFHIAGLARMPIGLGATTNALDGTATGQMLYAVPEYFPAAGTITRLVSRTNGTVGSAGSPRMKMGIYANGSIDTGLYAGSPYPGVRLAQGTDHDVWAGAANRTFDNVISVAVTAGTLLWFAFVINAQAATNQHSILGISRSVMFPILGFTFNVGTPTTFGVDLLSSAVGWRHAMTYTLTEDLPDPYPSSSPALMNGAGAGTIDVVNVPGIGFGFQPT